MPRHKQHFKTLKGHCVGRNAKHGPPAVRKQTMITAQNKSHHACCWTDGSECARMHAWMCWIPICAITIRLCILFLWGRCLCIWSFLSRINLKVNRISLPGWQLYESGKIWPSDLISVLAENIQNSWCQENLDWDGSCRAEGSTNALKKACVSTFTREVDVLKKDIRVVGVQLPSHQVCVAHSRTRLARCSLSLQTPAWLGAICWIGANLVNLSPSFTALFRYIRLGHLFFLQIANKFGFKRFNVH